MAHRVSQLQRGNSAKELKTNTNSGVTKPYPAKIKFWKVDPKSLPVLKCSHEIVVFQPPFEEMPITKIDILRDCSQIAIGLADGRVLLIEGVDVTRDSEQTLRRHMFAGVPASGTPVTCLYYTTPRSNRYVNVNTLALQHEGKEESTTGNSIKASTISDGTTHVSKPETVSSPNAEYPEKERLLPDKRFNT